MTDLQASNGRAPGGSGFSTFNPPVGFCGMTYLTLGDHPKAAIDDQVKSGHREKA
jgi:hypothetical protein